MKDFLEFLGRSSMVLFILTISNRVFESELNYNLSFALGGFLLIIWVFLPFLNKEKKE